MERSNIFRLIENERERQELLHPEGFLGSKETAMTVLAAEVGEVATAFLRERKENQINEVIQVAAVALRILEDLF